MKSEIVKVKETKEIDWSKPQVLEGNTGQLVLLTGEGQTLSTFGGVVIFRGSSYNNIGDYSSKFSKLCFTPITEPITIKFENE